MGDPQDRSNSDSCDSCQRHPQQNHGDTGQVCEQCFPGDKDATKLRSCGACSRVKYCSTDCQKKHWPQHKEACRAVQQAKKVRELLGPRYNEVRRAALADWAQTPQFEKAASFPFSWALGVGTDLDLTATHIILIGVDVQEYLTADNKPEFKFTLRSADCLTEEEVQSRSQSQIIETQPTSEGAIRVYIEDKDTKEIIICTLEAYRAMSNLRINIWPPPTQFRWFEHAKRVLSGTQTDFIESIYNTENDEARAQDNMRWYNEHGEHLGRAGLLALEVRTKPNRAKTHCLVAYVRVDEQKAEDGRLVFRRTIDRAETMKMQKLEQLFHCDVPETEGRRLLDNALAQAPARSARVFMIDEGLPFPKSIIPLAMGINAGDTGTANHPDGWLAWVKEQCDEN
ncbi:set and mynd domain-containing protein 3 [Moniliophthora roreri]|uniref:MYND-type domain-containing protein n=1 Tax=Moniliophthora roreri TaxID=221103 RepID=A0A0W0FS87_MONRR|nr:set and mynd domain-containing protein 3 [Moniliophthora roreri]